MVEDTSDAIKLVSSGVHYITLGSGLTHYSMDYWNEMISSQQMTVPMFGGGFVGYMQVQPVAPIEFVHVDILIQTEPELDHTTPVRFVEPIIDID